MDNEVYDRHLYDILIDIWEAYRETSTTGDASYFNAAFAKLHKEHEALCFTDFSEKIGMAFAPHVNRAVAMHK